MNKGVRPRLSVAVTDAPSVRSSSTTGRWPAAAANARAVSPSPPGVTLSMSSPFRRHLVQKNTEQSLVEENGHRHHAERPTTKCQLSTCHAPTPDSANTSIGYRPLKLGGLLLFWSG